jgi:hypothetical protein
MARVALYYPHWGIGDPRFMFDAMLYWDRLTCIVPHENFSCYGQWPSGLQREADRFHESFVTGIAPTDENKARVHDRLKALLSTEPPAWCKAENLAPSQQAVLATRKVSPRTLDMLVRRGWLVARGDDLGLISRAASGLLLSALAEEMASETMPAVTDEPETFRAACNGLLSELQSQHGIGGSQAEDFHLIGAASDGHHSELAIALAKITKLGVAAEAIEPGIFRRLHELCLDSGFDEQREHFRNQVDAYVEDLRQRPVLEHKAVYDHWQIELSKDRKALKRELRAAGIEAIVERDGIVATGIAAGVGAGIFAATGPIGLVIGMGIAGAGIARRARAKRIEIQKGRWTSWLAAVGG